MSDPPIGDLTVCAGYNDLAAFAFTVDKDYDLSTGADKELYLQFYRFSDHGTYVPIKVAGETTERGVTSAVDVGSPKLVRNDGSTWLFWRQDEDGLQYLTVSELLNAKAATSADPGDDGLWYTEAVRWAAKNGIANGYSESAFGPEDNVSREQLVTILHRYAQFKGIDVSVGEDTNILSYTDAFSVSGWAMAAMQWACGAGILNGKGDGTLAPADNASRAEVATMLMRFDALEQ